MAKQVPKARPLLLFRLGISLGKLLLLFDDTSRTHNSDGDDDSDNNEQQPQQQPSTAATASASASVAASSLGETAALVRALAQLFEVRW